jgi:hypothetical protein
MLMNFPIARLRRDHADAHIPPSARGLAWPRASRRPRLALQWVAALTRVLLTRSRIISAQGPGHQFDIAGTDDIKVLQRNR